MENSLTYGEVEEIADAAVARDETLKDAPDSTKEMVKTTLLKQLVNISPEIAQLALLGARSLKRRRND